ncbi:hypothetical protein V6B14_22745 (plasmid) [Sporosarcina psychrophila]|uniref:hypothetical protein n=1 Tax=Sporosarcina psychrophila TaxID=1476 RepID=UPI0030CFA4D1
MIFENYPRAKQIIEELNFHEHVQNTRWLQMTKEDAAINLARVILTKNAITSSSIPLKKIASIQVDSDYKEIGNLIQVFAKEEGRSQVGLTNDDVTKLFAHIEVGGSRYLQKPIN